MFCYTHAWSQGIYTEFGQNSVQKFAIEYSLKQENIEIIYFKGGENSAKNVLNQTNAILIEFEQRLNYNLSNGIKIIVYNNIQDYQKSNINITNPQHYAGGYTVLNDNTASVYFDGNSHEFNIQVRKAVAEIIVSEFIYGGNIRERVQTAALLNLPDWYFKGLVAYMAESWNISNDNYLKDFFQNKKQKQFTSLQKDDEVLAGHSIWRFLEEKYGKSAVSNIVFLTRVSRSIENSFQYYTGNNLNNLLNNWKNFYIEKYQKDELTFKLPKGEENAPKSLSKKYHTQFKISNDGKKIAIVTNTKGKYRIYIYNIKQKTIKEISSGGHQLLNRDMINNYPLIAWHPTKNILSVILYQNHKTVIQNYQEDGKLIKQETLKSIPFVKDLNYNNNGEKIIFSVLEDGHSQLILYSNNDGTSKILLDDEFDKLQPRFSKDNNHIYYTSNKLEDGTSSSFLSIYALNIQTLKSTFIIGNHNAQYNCYQAIEIENGFLSYLSDKNGIVNNYFYDLNKKVSLQMTNYKRSIHYNDISISSGKIADLLYFNNRFRIYIGEISENTSDDAVLNSEKTDYRKLLEKDFPIYFYSNNTTKNDSIINDSIIVKPLDTIHVKKVFISGFTEKDEKNVYLNNKNSAESIYKTYFKNRLGVNFFLQQFDNSILNNYLFPANVYENVFNYPLVSPVIMTSLSDPSKNYSIEAMARIPISIKATDFNLNYINRKGRWDKTFQVFRRSRTFEEFEIMKMISSQGKIGFRYPFNERSRIEINAGIRNDRVINMAADTIEYQKPDQIKTYAIHGFEYVFDNVKSNGLNLFDGLRFKLYSENYHAFNQYQFISNNGFDFRYYQKLHRQIYFALRTSGAWSLGTQTTAYYMGGVENWIIPARSDKNFNYDIPTLTGDAFAFQTLAAPVRGFLRNSRGGNKFALMNAEIRVPFFAYLTQKPINSEFIRSLMLIGFVDIGTAWQGRSPFSKENPFNTRIVQSTQYTVTVNTQRDPFLYAFGIGARAKILGHYIKVDHGWGLFENKFQKAMTTFSVGLDF
ncbi:MAG: hypothetical protein Q8K70_12245 [Bacteroidota bacterium]|nr:hypothetical protein [Bacteroidota bacterium]